MMSTEVVLLDSSSVLSYQKVNVQLRVRICMKVLLFIVIVGFHTMLVIRTTAVEPTMNMCHKYCAY